MNTLLKHLPSMLALVLAMPAAAEPTLDAILTAANQALQSMPANGVPTGPAAGGPAPSQRIGTVETIKPGARRAQGKAPAEYAPIDPKHDAAAPLEINMFAGETRVFPTPGVARIAVGNGGVITANALDDKEIIIFGNAPGTSTLYVWNEDGRYQRIRVNVSPGETDRVAREVAAFLQRIPKAKASVVGDKVIVEGDELSDEDRDKVAELAKRYPQIVNFTSPVGWEQTVMMDVKVVEFPKSELRELGLKWQATGGAAIGGIWAPGVRGDVGGRQVTILTPPSAPAPIGPAKDLIGLDGKPIPGNSTLPSGLAVISALNMGLNAQLSALEQDGKAAILAEPQLSTRSGFKASFLAGGEVPYSVTSINGVTVVFKPYGVKLDIEPKVGRNGIIRATIESEVSSIDPANSTPVGPALLTRKTKTEFNVRAGETIVLSGLLQRDLSNSVDKVPFLGDIPVLGALFRSKRYQNKETELVVFMTPSIVDSRTPELVERIQRTNQRLQDALPPAASEAPPAPSVGRQPDAHRPEWMAGD